MKEHHQFHKEANTLFWCGVAFTFVWRGITAISGYFSYRLDGISDEKKTEKKVRDGNRPDCGQVKLEVKKKQDRICI